MAKMNPISLSPNRDGRTIPNGEENDAPERKDRAINPKGVEIGEGPIVDDNGGHLPSRFKLDNGTIVTHR